MKKLIIRGMGNRYFSKKVVEWYLQNKRELPWRGTKDPYKIWLSEIILQQTRVNQGLPYFHRFIEAFPTIRHLADASEQKVLRLWQGLGYYSRARNLHKCAQVIANEHGGVFPKKFNELVSLPGIGSYTAAAIGSISFNQPFAVVDGNVFRLLARVFGIEEPINSPQGKKTFTDLANSLINPEKPALHNQAMMEFGSLQCKPQNPDCDRCVLKRQCIAFQRNLQSLLPIKLNGRPVRKRYFYYVVFRKGNSLFMKKRSEKDIWQGLYDFYLIEKKRSKKIETLVTEDPVLKSIRGKMKFDLGPLYKHVLSHQLIQARFITVTVSQKQFPVTKELRSYSLKKISALPKSALITRFLQDSELLKLP